jgi:DeoR family fructose operon transcriptional repressor
MSRPSRDLGGKDDRILLKARGIERSAGRIDVSDMAGRLSVPAESIRKDLTELERQGLVRRVHGGVVTVEQLSFEPAVAAHIGYGEEKRRIARTALRETPHDGAVLIDAGSTRACLAEIMPADRDLAVFTSALGDRRTRPWTGPWRWSG